MTLSGRDIYLGRYGSVESKAEYDRLIAEWLIRGRTEAPSSGPSDALTVTELVQAFSHHALEHYRTPSGSPSGELDNLRDAIKPLRRLYGHTAAAEFGPLALRAVRAQMIEAGLARTTVNARVNRIRRVFTWGVSVQLIPPSVIEALRTVQALEKGRSGARETDGVEPVPAEHVEAVLPLLPRPVAAMVRLQLLTGCRAGEVMAMRGCDLIPGEPNWEYQPASHKNAWRGIQRVIPLGPRAVTIVREFLRTNVEDFLFDPREAVAAHHEARALGRKTRSTPFELARRCPNRPGQKHAHRYDRRSYRQAIVRACVKAGVPAWSPLRLRHAAATLIRARYGLEAAANVLGHARPDTTLLYAERDLTRAHSIATEIG